MNRLIAAIFCSLLLASSVASAQDTSRQGGIRDTSQHTRPMNISGMVYVPWIYGIGIGVNARVEIPVVHDGFIPAINDQFSIEPSLGIAYRSYGRWGTDLKLLDIAPAVYATWSFHITPKFRPYATIGLGYDIELWLNEDDYNDNYDYDTGYVYWDTAVGLFYNFSDNVAFRGELGARGPKAGLAVYF